METIVKEINKLNIGEAHSLISLAFNKAQEFEWGTEERKVWEEVSELATKRFAELYVKSTKKTEKASASVQFGKFEHENFFGEIEYRQLTVDITLTAETEEGVENLWYELAEKLEEASDLDICWSTCPTIEQNRNGSWYFSESFCVEYEHGMMGIIKKEFMADFKAVKKEMGIR